MFTHEHEHRLLRKHPGNWVIEQDGALLASIVLDEAKGALPLRGGAEGRILMAKLLAGPIVEHFQHEVGSPETPLNAGTIYRIVHKTIIDLALMLYPDVQDSRLVNRAAELARHCAIEVECLLCGMMNRISPTEDHDSWGETSLRPTQLFAS